jgi:hypothetical protein
MMTCQIPQHEETSRFVAQRHVSELRPRVEDFVQNVKGLPKPVRESPPIALLTVLPFCSDAIMAGVGQRSDSEAFRNARDLVDRIGHWLLMALRIADRILEQHFEKKARGS